MSTKWHTCSETTSRLWRVRSFHTRSYTNDMFYYPSIEYAKPSLAGCWISYTSKEPTTQRIYWARHGDTLKCGSYYDLYSSGKEIPPISPIDRTCLGEWEIRILGMITSNLWSHDTIIWEIESRIGTQYYCDSLSSLLTLYEVSNVTDGFGRATLIILLTLLNQDRK